MYSKLYEYYLKGIPTENHTHINHLTNLIQATWVSGALG